MKSKRNRLISMLLSVVMLLGIISAMPLTASANAAKYPYTIFGLNAVQINASGMNINGNGKIASNGTITVPSNFNQTNKLVQNANESMIFIDNKIESTYFSGNNVQVHTTDYELTNQNLNINNPIKVVGNLTLKGGHINPANNIGLMATGNISLSGDGMNFNNNVVYSKNGDITIDSRNSIGLSGLIYAPNGNIVISGQGVNLNSVVIIAQNVTINSQQSVNINYSDNFAEIVGIESEESDDDDVPDTPVYGNGGTIAPPINQGLTGAHVINGNVLRNGTNAALDINVLDLVNGTGIKASEVYGIKATVWSLNGEGSGNTRQLYFEVNGVSSPMFCTDTTDPTRIFMPREAIHDVEWVFSSAQLTALEQNPATFDIRIRAGNAAWGVGPISLIGIDGEVLGLSTYSTLGNNGSWSEFTPNNLTEEKFTESTEIIENPFMGYPGWTEIDYYREETIQKNAQDRIQDKTLKKLENVVKDLEGFQWLYLNFEDFCVKRESCKIGNHPNNTKDIEISPEAIEAFDKTLENLMKNGGSAYIAFKGCNPSDFEIALRHVEQLGEVISRYPNVVRGIMGLGEGQYNSEPSTLVKYIDTFMENTPESVMLMLSDPDQMSIYFGVKPSDLPNITGKKATEKGSNEYRLSYVNYGYMGNYKDMGRWKTNDRENELRFLASQSEHAPCSVEFAQVWYCEVDGVRYESHCADECKSHANRPSTKWSPLNNYKEEGINKENSIHLPENAIPEFYYTNLNHIVAWLYTTDTEIRGHNPVWGYNEFIYGEEIPNTNPVQYTAPKFETENKYKVQFPDNSAFYGLDCYTFIRTHLGYRLVLRESNLTSSAKAGETLDLQGKIENTGFANVLHEPQAQILLEKDGAVYICDVNINASDIKSATDTVEEYKPYEYNLTLALPASMQGGNYNVYLRFTGSDVSDYAAAKSGIRFANNGDIFNQELGANKIGTIDVLPSDQNNSAAADTFIQIRDNLNGNLRAGAMATEGAPLLLGYGFDDNSSKSISLSYNIGDNINLSVFDYLHSDEPVIYNWNENIENEEISTITFYTNDPNGLNSAEVQTQLAAHGITKTTGEFIATFDESVKRIRSTAFKDYKSLKGVIFTDNITAMSAYAFEGCTSLENVVIPKNLISIGERAFAGCTNLSKVYMFPVKEDGISENCFIDSPNVTVYINERVKQNYFTEENPPYYWHGAPVVIMESEGEKDLKITGIITSDAGVYKRTATVAGKKHTTVSVKITVTDHSFTDWNEIKLPTCTTIGKAERKCTTENCGLVETKILPTLSHVGGTPITTASTCTIRGEDITSCVLCDEVISNKIYRTLGHDYVYISPKKICTVCGDEIDFRVLFTDTDSDGVLSAGEVNSQLLNVTGEFIATFDSSITKIGDRSFRNNINLKEVWLSDSITAIDSVAFGGCTLLKTVTFSKSVSTVNSRVFENCTNLMSLTFKTSIPPNIGNTIFTDCTAFSLINPTAKIYVPLGAKAAYDSTSLTPQTNWWWDDSNIIEVEFCETCNNYPCTCCPTCGKAATDGHLIKIGGTDYCPTLTTLDLSGQGLTSADIEPLTGMVNLTELVLQYNNIADLSSLSGLTNLVELHLRDNQFNDLTPLEGLVNLQVLDIRNNYITLYQAKALQEQLPDCEIIHNALESIIIKGRIIPMNSTSLDLSGLGLEDSDIKDLVDMTNLVWLNLKDNNISNLSQLSGLTNLEWLNLSENQITDFIPVKILPNLQYLDMSDNPIAFWQVVKLENDMPYCQIIYNEHEYIKIKRMRIRRDEIELDLSNINLTNSDIEPLSMMTNLKYLWLSNNQNISDISSLSGLNSLEYLYLENNSITNIEPLSGLTSLKKLDLHWNRINNISPLQDLVNLEWLDLSENDIIKIDYLWQLSKLKTLNLADNAIRDPYVITYFENLEWVSFCRNYWISDVIGLTGMKSLRFLDLQENPNIPQWQMDSLRMELPLCEIYQW